jgi:hypothetical protein
LCGREAPVKKPKPSAKNKPAPKKATPKPKAKAKPAAKPAPKKVAVKKPAAKPAAKKTVPAKKVVAKKPAAKAATKVAPKPVAKTVAKPAAKPAAKPVAKAAEKPAAKPVAKAVAKVAEAVVEKPAKAAKAAPEAKVAKVAKVKGEGKSKDAKDSKTAAPADAFPALDANVKRPAKPFFLEVKPGVERVIKRGDKSAVSQVIDLQARRKGPAAEETSDELAERIERELQSQSFLKRAPMRPQLCTKCGINAVTPRFTIDRELGYCESCAEILHLGETKEARRMEFNLAVKKEEIAPPSPDEIAAEDAEGAEGDEEAVPDLDV